MRIEHSIEIDCTADHLWTWIEDPEKQKQWITGLVSSEPLNDLRGVGARSKLIMKEGDARVEYDAEVIEYLRPRTLTVRMTGGTLGGDHELTARYNLLAQTFHCTLLEFEETIEVNGFLKKLLFALAGRLVKFQLKGHLRELKRLSESSVGGPPNA